MEQINRLQEHIAGLAEGGLCVAFSGGVDSALVLKIAAVTGQNVHAVYINNHLSPAGDSTAAQKMAAEFGVPFTVLDMDLSADREIMDNPPDRCYRCKKKLFIAVCDYAKVHTLKTVADGTNADDLTAYRPGRKALAELGVQSPLAELGITKQKVRMYAERLDISAAHRPAASCLLTRFSYNTKVNENMLKQVEQCEALLHQAGYPNCRVRLHGAVARIEIQKEQFADFLKEQALIEKIKQQGIGYITLDLEGLRSGSMDEGL